MKLVLLFSLLVALSESKKLRVFILAGQSNMQGHGYVAQRLNGTTGPFKNGSLEYLVADDRTKAEFGKLKAADGSWKNRSDVWITYNETGSGNPGVANHSWHGELTIGYGGDAGRDTAKEMGPELGFGWALGDAIDDQVLLIKTAWGGKSLDTDFRPPSSAKKWGGVTGPFYSMMIAEVKQTVSNLATLFAYDGEYELAGFAWHQGWNDACSKNAANYSIDLPNLIQDVRRDLSGLHGGAALPWSIGVSGMIGYAPYTGSAKHCQGAAATLAKQIIPAQFAVADPVQHPEFKGTVAAVETRQYHRDAMYSPGGQCYHWNNNCESYWRVGQAMGGAMLKLLEQGRPYTN